MNQYKKNGYGGDRMKLTRRRYQFLEALARLVEEGGGPVHYGDVADSLDVSKWTAYDMMLSLIHILAR